MDKRLQDMLDKHEIRECLNNYSRGVDRFDRELLLSVYHPDAIDDHGVGVMNREQFVDWVFKMHTERQERHVHSLLNSTIDLDGDTAHVETYFLYLGVDRAKPNRMNVGRYLDRMERRDGRWAIAARVCLVEGMYEVADFVLPPEYRARIESNGPITRDRTDRSYERPLKINREAFLPG